MNKRLIALVLALLLFAGSALAETALIEKINVEPGFPVVNEPVDVSIMVIPQWGAVDFKPERNWMVSVYRQIFRLECGMDCG